MSRRLDGGSDGAKVPALPATGAGTVPLEVLYDAGGPAFPLPDALVELYGGPLGFETPRVFANFVQTTDGVVAIPSVPLSNKLIAGGSAADRFVMGLLRACADVVVVGSGTMRDSPGGHWTAEQAFPDAAAGFAELRRRLGKPPEVEAAVLSASGAVDPAHPVFARGGLVLTTDEGAAFLGERLPAEQVLALGAGPFLDVAAAVGALRARGHALILSEGGPRVFGSLLAAGLVDELFLTVSPRHAGPVAHHERLSLVEEADLVPGGPQQLALLGIRRDGGHLFLRYELRRS
jgi:riboflavin biosynthesis pyrimidine reductase